MRPSGDQRYKHLLIETETQDIYRMPRVSQWIFLLLCFLPASLAALLALQDIDTLALAGESPLYIEFFVKWLVVVYLWPLMMIPAWILNRRPFLQRRPLLYVLCQVSLGPAIAHIHIAVFYAILSRFDGMGPFALRHPRAYYMASRHMTEVVLYYGLVICLHAVLLYRRSQSERFERLHLENELLLAQLQMLSIQLQPHFLFNTLNSISSLMRKDVDAADDLLIEVGTFLRKTLAISTRSTIPLDEELALVRSYYQLQNIRYANRALLALEIAPTTLGVQVPPMILQPIIENSFKHSRSESLTIDVSSYLEQDTVRLRIENNGAQLQENAIVQSETKIGLSNVRGRLHGMYGNASSFSIRNRSDDGVCVEMTIPVESHGGFTHD